MNFSVEWLLRKWNLLYFVYYFVCIYDIWITIHKYSISIYTYYRIIYLHELWRSNCRSKFIYSYPGDGIWAPFIYRTLDFRLKIMTSNNKMTWTCYIGAGLCMQHLHHWEFGLNKLRQPQTYWSFIVWIRMEIIDFDFWVYRYTHTHMLKETI